MKQALLAEDLYKEREQAKSILIDNGYEVTEVTTGQEALDKFQANQYDLFVLDNYLDDDVKGLEVASYIRQQNSNVPIVMNSSCDFHREASRLNAGNAMKNPRTLAFLVREICEKQDITTEK